MTTTTVQDVELCVGELYRDEEGHEVWLIKEIETGKVLRDCIASDHDYRWLLDAFNHGDGYADARESKCAAATAYLPGAAR